MPKAESVRVKPAAPGAELAEKIDLITRVESLGYIVIDREDLTGVYTTALCSCAIGAYQVAATTLVTELFEILGEPGAGEVEK